MSHDRFVGVGASGIAPMEGLLAAATLSDTRRQEPGGVGRSREALSESF